MEYVKNFNFAIDIGGHCGLWSMQMIPKFKRVVAFEPIPHHRECFVKNAPEAELIPYALGEKEAEVLLKTKASSSGDTKVSEDGDVKAEVKTLDSYDFQDVGFIKIDTEGYELFILKGAEQTIKRCKPVLIVEQKPSKASKYGVGDTDAVPWLEARGYKLKDTISGDYIFA